MGFFSSFKRWRVRIYKSIPWPIKWSARRPYYFVMDTIDLLLGRRDELAPPRRMGVGGGDFRKQGEEGLKYFVELCGLKPDERVLDIGCGSGRMAFPLTGYLDKRGSYEGFDIVADEINWDRIKITAKYPNFHFQLADIYNKAYNPKGKYKASEYKFPFGNGSFDFIFLTSVFTHMLPQDMENYFSEIARVLKRDGRCLITFFLLNTESIRLIETKSSLLDFQYRFKRYWTIDKNAHEAAVAYDEKFIRGLYEKYGLSIAEPISYGSWCKRKKFLNYQDIVIAIKK